MIITDTVTIKMGEIVTGDRHISGKILGLVAVLLGQFMLVSFAHEVALVGLLVGLTLAATLLRPNARARTAERLAS